jgi:signal transduction histidine kinase
MEGIVPFMTFLDMAGLVAAIAALAWALARRSALPWVAGAAGAVSLAVTVGRLAVGALSPGEDLTSLAEGMVFVAVTALLARRCPVRHAVPACALTGAAASTWLLRYHVQASMLEAVGMCAFWSLGVLGAVGGALYLRYLDNGRGRAVREAKAEQRLRLAGDLHDFVAHDVSEMVAQAQAGQLVGAADPAQSLLALRRVEVAGLRAMETLDRTVLELHAPGLAELPALATRFSSAGARVRLSVAEGLEVPYEADVLAYRIVVEALTNVRRHAPEATEVRVDARVNRGRLLITVDNEGATPVSGGPRGGFGLAGLRERVEAAGGELTSAAVPRGWRLTARLPLAQ